jgi:hypothetical protein
MRLLLAAAATAAVLLAAPGTANASHDPSGAPFDEDFVVGTAGFGPPQAGLTATIDAHSGPAGENATGTATFGARQTFFGGPVTCLNVTGNRAVIGGDSEFEAPAGYLFLVVDNAATGTPDQFGQLFPPPIVAPSTCPANLDVPLQEATSGDLVVHDAQPFPTSKDQCKNGGWRNYPGFRNQGDCVSFVATGGK